MEKVIDKKDEVLPVTELIQLWHESGRSHMEIDSALVGTAIVGTSKAA